jgi:hypothetical protein
VPAITEEFAIPVSKIVPTVTRRLACSWFEADGGDVSLSLGDGPLLVIAG